MEEGPRINNDWKSGEEKDRPKRGASGRMGAGAPRPRPEPRPRPYMRLGGLGGELRLQMKRIDRQSSEMTLGGGRGSVTVVVSRFEVRERRGNHRSVSENM
jgi:hypothetical protein